MLHMSFYTVNGNDKLQPFDRSKIEELIKTTEKEIRWRQGFEYRGAKAIPIPKDKALDVIKDSFLDVDEYENYIILNTFSANDMW